MAGGLVGAGGWRWGEGKGAGVDGRGFERGLGVRRCLWRGWGCGFYGYFDLKKEM